MAAKPRNKAGMDAESVARLVAAQERADEPPTSPHARPLPPGIDDPGQVDGRTLRRTGREPFATRIKPETHADLRRIAHARGISIAEALETAVAAFIRN